MWAIGGHYRTIAPKNMLPLIYQFTWEDIATTTYYAGELIKDFLPILLLILGLSLGLWFFGSILRRR